MAGLSWVDSYPPGAELRVVTPVDYLFQNAGSEPESELIVTGTIAKVTQA